MALSLAPARPAADLVDLGLALGAGAPAGVAARRLAVPPGPPGVARLLALEAPALLLAGAILRTVHAGRRAAALLHGPGDVVASGLDEPEPFSAHVRPLATSTVAVLDARAMAALAERPALGERLFARLGRQADLLALQAVVTQLTSVSERLAALLPVLADRWGTVSAQGVILPAFLSHTVLAELIGVRRPSLTTALIELDQPGLRRLDDRRWLVSPALAGLAA